ncbi:hypothetical protein FRC04_010188, partial [Tulasnella sp. 424]
EWLYSATLNLPEKADVVHRVWFISDDYAMVQSNMGGIQAWDIKTSLSRSLLKLERPTRLVPAVQHLRIQLGIMTFDWCSLFEYLGEGQVAFTVSTATQAVYSLSLVGEPQLALVKKWDTASQPSTNALLLHYSTETLALYSNQSGELVKVHVADAAGLPSHLLGKSVIWGTLGEETPEEIAVKTAGGKLLLATATHEANDLVTLHLWMDGDPTGETVIHSPSGDSASVPYSQVEELFLQAVGDRRSWLRWAWKGGYVFAAAIALFWVLSQLNKTTPQLDAPTTEIRTQSQIPRSEVLLWSVLYLIGKLVRWMKGFAMGVFSNTFGFGAAMFNNMLDVFHGIGLALAIVRELGRQFQAWLRDVASSAIEELALQMCRLVPQFESSGI